VKRFLVFALVFVFMTVMANADEKGKTCSETCKVKCAAGKAVAAQTTGTEAKAACEGMKTGDAMKTEEAPAAVINAKDAAATATLAAPKIAETCPDTKDQAALENFHKAMQPMHAALEENKYAELRGGYTDLAKASEGIKTYNCPMSDKCTPECKKSFDGKKADLLKSVEELGVACNGTDDKKLEASFMTMHEAYVGFASMCQHEKPAAEEKK
jgi:hypothetical protein